MILEAINITKKFNRLRQDSNVFTAVSETNLSLEPGSFYVVSGASGSGKSTLLNMLSGLLAPDGGKVLLDGKELYSLDDKELSLLRIDHMGFLPQGQTALYSLNVLENVLIPCTLNGEKALDEKYALSLLDRLGISELADVMPSELSGGEIRRMAIARALIRRPAFLFADEPTGDLDRENTRLILELFRSLADHGTCIFLVSHDTEAFSYGDIIYSMEKGVLNRRNL
jgi:putative ABC transport system ATP-binding protein